MATDQREGPAPSITLVLFFAAASSRLGSPRAQWILLGVAITFLIIATVVLGTFPIDL
jgi:hypothetical protein